MEIRTLLRANIKSHMGGLGGVFVLLFLVSLSLAAVLSVWISSGRYVRQEMDRLGFGEITAWVSRTGEAEPLLGEILAVDGVESVGVQPVIFSEYEIGEQKSDSEGQLLEYDPETYRYKIFNGDLSSWRQEYTAIGPGEIFVSPSMQSLFGLHAGDMISFPTARNGVKKTFTVKGYFEDPFMGSTMIGMKSFLISRQDRMEILQQIKDAGADSLGRFGFMFHISQKAESGLGASDLNIRINEGTSLPQFVEFTHSRDAISGFMLTLQNVFTGIMAAFAAILFAASLAVLSHCIGSFIEQDTVNMGILKTMGITGKKLRLLQILQYFIPAALGILSGTFFSVPVVFMIFRMTLTTTGLLIPLEFPAGLTALCFGGVLTVLFAFIFWKTGRAGAVSPMTAIRNGADSSADRMAEKRERRFFKQRSAIRKKGLEFWIALRQLSSGKKRYAGICLVAAFLVFFVSLTGRIDSWLGPDGKGLMDAFNPAGLHIAAQPAGKATAEDVESVIASYTDITGSYGLAMPGVSVNGVDYTANVITDSSRFHLLRGKTCEDADEIVLTEFAAADLNVGIGDSVTVSGALGSRSYVVSGIYQCANDMGANVGMNREGYERVGKAEKKMWCIHYFLEDPSRKPEVMLALKDTFGGDVYLHENSWPGLNGILSAMKLLMIFLHGISAVFILVVTFLTGNRLLLAEQKDMGIYKTLGFSTARLRLAFAVRFGIAVLPGAVAGMACSAFLTDPVVSAFFKAFGISDFSSRPGFFGLLMPVIFVTGLFVLFAWTAAGKLRKLPLTVLMNE